LEEYVLADFTSSESQELPQVVEKGASVTEEWLKLGKDAAVSLAANLSKLGCP
jgi:peptidyl-tRNA hydrolase